MRRVSASTQFASSKATLVLDPGWADGYTINGLAPQPLTEGSRDGKLSFGFGHVPAGRHLTFWLSLQINPTNIGRHGQDVWLRLTARSCRRRPGRLLLRSRPFLAMLTPEIRASSRR